MNLLSNAVKFSDRGSVTFKVSLATDVATDLVTDVADVATDGVTDVADVATDLVADVATDLVADVADVAADLVADVADGVRVSPDGLLSSDNLSVFQADVTDKVSLSPDQLSVTSVTPSAATSVTSVTSVTKSAAKIRFEVEDTGIGMTPEQLTKIFLPFEQVGDNSRRNEGTGLGLAITQKIISIMGSKIFVESTPEVGSRFWFDLNLPIASSWMEPTSIKSSTPIIGYEGERRKLLIVDDRWENRSILIKMLEPIGFELIEAVNGQDGLEKAIEVQPDLIIADLVMPVMNGWEMARRLRELPQFQSITIIAISANAFEVDRQKSLEAGCNDFLPKPVQAEDLLNQIKNSLNLSWIYDSTYQYQLKQFSNESSYSQRATQSEIVIPPSSELVKLYQAAQSGKVQGVEHEIMRLQQLNPEYIAFAIRIMELAVDFEYEEIAQILEPYLS